ncbi:hypothetical protein A2U01_0027566, partial [Trifolium medium]|nr:hypothetical protein [Trifolium medium]
MMNKVFKEEIWDMLEVYMDDMIIKSAAENEHETHLNTVFNKVRKERGIEANPNKCDAIIQTETPSSKERIMKLNGMITTLNKFISRSPPTCSSILQIAEKKVSFERTTKCEEAFSQLKKALSQPPVLSRPMEGETLYIYLAVSTEAVSVVLVREVGTNQSPVYFVSKALSGPELRYQKIEKIAFALIAAARKL